MLQGVYALDENKRKYKPSYQTENLILLPEVKAWLNKCLTPPKIVDFDKSLKKVRERFNTKSKPSYKKGNTNGNTRSSKN